MTPVVIGGGVMGTSIARHLARAGCTGRGPRRAGRTRLRLHLEGGGRGAGAVLRRAQHPARGTQPGGVRAVRGGDRAGHRTAPGRLPLPAVDTGTGRLLRGGRAAPELPRRPEPHDRPGRGPAALPAHHHGRPARRRLLARRRPLHPRVGGVRLRRRRPPPRRDDPAAHRGHRHRAARRRRHGRDHHQGPDRHRHGDLRSRSLVAGRRRDGGRRPAGGAAAPARSRSPNRSRACRPTCP